MVRRQSLPLGLTLPPRFSPAGFNPGRARLCRRSLRFARGERGTRSSVEETLMTQAEMELYLEQRADTRHWNSVTAPGLFEEAKQIQLVISKYFGVAGLQRTIRTWVCRQ